jgi:hypothetical protein
VWHISVLAQQLAASCESSPARRLCELFVCVCLYCWADVICISHLAGQRMMPCRITCRRHCSWFSVSTTTTTDQRDGPKHFPAQQSSIRAYSETLPAGWFTSSAALHTRLNFALFQKCHFHLAVLASPFCPSCPTLPQNIRNFFQFYFISITTWKPDQTVS